VLAGGRNAFALPILTTATKFDGTDSDHAVEGYNPGPGQAGVYGHTSDDDSVGVLAANFAATTDAVGLRASSKNGTAILVNSANVGVDVTAATTAIKASGSSITIDATVVTPTSIAILGRAPGGLQSVGVMGTGDVGIDGRGTSIGAAGVGDEYGVQAIASTDEASCLYLYPWRFDTLADKVPGPSKPGAHGIGELDMDGQGNLWQCVTGGTPGVWRKIGGPATGGAFHPLPPGRVYDSRLPLPTPGTIASGTSRTISVADRREVAGGTVDLANFVPAGATAVAANLTVVAVSGGGFLAANPGGITVVSASNVNWTAAGQIIANSAIATLNPSRQLELVVGGAGVIHVVVDISGYWL
jgi:hypothetical protein